MEGVEDVELSISPSLEPSESLENFGVTLTPDIHEVMREMNFQHDEMDSAEFSVIEFINKEFPNEQSLVNLDPVLTKLRIKISQTEGTIAKEVRTLSSAGDKASNNLEIAQHSILDLFSKIDDIKQKADQSEKMVKEICSGIKQLDNAKRNITTTITGLKRIHMLVTGVNQLQEWTSRRQYREVGKLLEAVNQLSAYFSKEAKYQSMERISKLTSAVEAIKEELKGKVREEFFDNTENPLSPTQLSDVCFVIDALGDETKDSFKRTFCNNQMTEYTRSFGAGDESARLEFCDRRFLWATRKLREYEQKFEDVFPPSWKMSEMLCEYFGKRTSEHFSNILEKHSPDVKILLHALRETLKWEKEMCGYFGKQSMMQVDTNEPEQEMSEEEEDEEEEGNQHSAAAIARRYKKFKRQKEREEQKNQPKLQMSKKFRGIISTSFDSYMNIYVSEEDALMRQKIESIISTETWEIEDDARNKVLRGSTDLILYFKKSMKRCTELTCNEAFFEMYKLFKKYLKYYAQVLLKSLPSPSTNTNRAQYILSEKAERKVCLIINTGEYCSSLCKQLASTVKGSIDKEFKDKIDMKSNQQEFSGVIAQGLKVLVGGMQSKVQTALLQMSQMPWGSWVTVIDQSEYVNQFSSYLAQTVPLYNDWLSMVHSRFFCDSFAGEFVPMLVHFIYKCGKISEIGAEQLLLDIAAIKGFLVGLPALTNTRGGEPNAIPARYVKYVNKEIGKAEKILKVILSAPSVLDITFVQLLPKATEQLFVKLMDLKGIPRGDHPRYLQAYRRAKAKDAKDRKSKQK